MKNLAWSSLLLTTAGCATMVSGPKQKVTIDSTPSGATVHVQEQTAVTPATVLLERKNACTIQVSKAGYDDAFVDLHVQENPWVWGNYFLSVPLLCFPWGSIDLLPGMIVDRQTGAACRLAPDRVHVELRPNAEP